MKTWTNPTVEELEVKVTAEGWLPTDIESLGDLGIPSDDYYLLKKRQNSCPPNRQHLCHCPHDCMV